MKKKILELLKIKVHPMSSPYYIIGLDIADCEDSAEEITAHMMEFIDYELKDWGVPSTIEWIEKDYAYWINNVKK